MSAAARRSTTATAVVISAVLLGVFRAQVVRAFVALTHTFVHTERAERVQLDAA